MKFVLCLICCLAFGVITSCGGGPSSVSAQSGYSNASLKGTYALSITGDWTLGQEFTGIGTISFDGNGSVSGSIAELVFVSGPSCTATLAGTYTVSSSGSGTAQIAANQGSNCDQAWSGSVAFNLESAESGDSVFFASTLPAPAFTAAAIKQ